MQSKSLNNLFKIWKFSRTKNKIAFCLISVLSIISAVFESLVILSFVPLISSFTSNTSTDFIRVPVFLDFIGGSLNTKTYLILFILLVILSAILRLLFIYSASMNAADLGSSLSTDCYKSILKRPYIDQISKDSSKSIEMITTNVTRAIQVIISVSVLISSIFLSSTIIYVLLQASWKSTIIIVFSVFSCYYILYSISKGGLYENGKIVQNYSVKAIAIIKESIDSIRDIILNNLFKDYLEKFQSVDSELKKRVAISSFIAQYPRFIIEAVIFIIMSYVAYTLSKSDSTSEILSLLALVSLGFIRLIPAIQQIYTNLSNIKTFSYSLELINECLEEDLRKKSEKKSYEEEILIKNSLPILRLKNINFTYPLGKSRAISHLSMQIKAGQKIAIVGPSGSGKSTLLDILLGLLPPDEGEALFYGFNLLSKKIRDKYHRMIAHVPQSPIILNASIKENITFTSNYVVMEKLERCINSVMLSDLVKKNGINYICGEDGCNLSGGQKQRLAIARALYAEKEILLLDECTSSLDQNTENIVLTNILDLYKDKTVISITHKLRTLDRYDQVMDMTKLN
tara:strand:+ start:3563 stop:5275 length:1713 start_codon:yes stop_codon:yes gene_type:complete